MEENELSARKHCCNQYHSRIVLAFSSNHNPQSQGQRMEHTPKNKSKIIKAQFCAPDSSKNLSHWSHWPHPPWIWGLGFARRWKKPEGWGVQQTLKVCDPFPKQKYQQQEKSRALVSPCKRPKCCSFCSRKGKNEWVKEQSYFVRFWSTNPDKTSAGMDTQAAGWASGEVGITQLPLKHSVTQHNGDILLLNKAIWGFFI